MKIYIRKIDNQCVEKQISVLKSIVNEFFGENLIIEDNANVVGGKTIKFIGVDSETKKEGYVRILPQTDPRLSSADIKAVITGELVVGDFLVFYENKGKYDIELIKPTDSKYNVIQQLCIRDERHTLLYTDNTEVTVNLENNKERFKQWLIKKEYSESSVTQYVNHVSLTSKESLEKGVIDCNLYDILNLEKLNIAIQKVKQTDEFKTRKQNGNGINEAALNLYLEFAEENLNQIMINEDTRLKEGYNKIVYGVPGCGKSYYVTHNIIDNDPNKGNVYRTTFYPDYTNGDFVGQVIPKLNIKNETSVLYDIQSGPFADALLNAILNPTKNTYLIIEEINRGNAAAIFGDVFQLLDRNINGFSEYSIKNYIISTYLHKMIDNKYSIDYDLDNIRIPSNLILIGTMNTSDQNVFTLDTAFKRRWKMEYIKNDVDGSKFANELVPLSNVTWAQFVKEVNNYITGDNGLDINGEDKQIGAYFISSLEWNDIKTSKDPKGSARIFAEKVLSYIWDDVAKINRDSWFDSNKYRTLDSLVSSFIEKGLEVFNDNISFTRSEMNNNKDE